MARGSAQHGAMNLTCKLSPFGGRVSALLRHLVTVSSPNSRAAASLLIPCQKNKLKNLWVDFQHNTLHLGLLVQPCLYSGLRICLQIWIDMQNIYICLPADHHSSAHLEQGQHIQAPFDMMLSLTPLPLHPSAGYGFHHQSYLCHRSHPAQALVPSWNCSAIPKLRDISTLQEHN